MISANNVTLRIGKRALFEDVNIKFTEGNCYGLIGANGAGKSTFLKILSGVIEPSKGDIAITPGQRLSVLEQDHYKYDDYQVLDTVILGNKRLYEIMKEKDAIYAKEDFTDEDGVRASELEGEFADLNGWEAESDAATLLNGLGIETDLHYAYMRELDGGRDGLDFYRSITEFWKDALRPGGALIFEVGFDQADPVEQLMAQQGYHDIDTRLDTQNIWRLVEGRL